MTCPVCDHRYSLRRVVRRGGRIVYDDGFPTLLAQGFHACIWCIERLNLLHEAKR